MSQYTYLADMDPEVAAMVARLPPPPLIVDINEARIHANGSIDIVKQILEPQLPDASTYRVQDHQVPVEGGEILVRSIVPILGTGHETDTFPLLFWMHGGGWCVGSIELDDYYLRRIAVEMKFSILNVEYRLAPEYTFPTGLNDCYTSLRWAVDNLSLFQASLDKGFIIGGCSSGANFSAVLAFRVRDDPYFEGRRLTGQLLQVPATVHPDAYPDEYKSELLSLGLDNAPIISPEMLQTFPKLLGASPTDPEFSVLLNTNRKGLAPAYFQIAGFDPLRDEGLLYEKLLREAGVKTKLDAYPGLPHGAHVFLRHLPVGQKFENDTKDGIRWLLN